VAVLALLVSEPRKTQNSFVGVAYTENQRSSRFSSPKWRPNQAFPNPSVNSRSVQTSKCLVWCRLPGNPAIFSPSIGLLGLPNDKMIAASVQAQ
jgi:hypothetical protein